MLSIVIPTYNDNCIALLDSLLVQIKTVTAPIEIIVCDDCSTLVQLKKKTETYCDKNNIQFLKNISNLGRTATRNILAHKARYKWLLFLDADVVIENENFIKEYLSLLPSPYSIITGGTSYDHKMPQGKELRWKYGVQRESKKAKERMKNPYFIISQNLLINKKIFLKLNNFEERRYGLDNILSYQIQHQSQNVLHKNNPVLHKGLEDNKVFLNKSIQAIETLVYFEKKKRIPPGFTSLQKSYLKLKKVSGLSVFTAVLKPFITRIKKNLVGNNPSLLLFDLYRLNTYINLKRNA